MQDRAAGVVVSRGRRQCLVASSSRAGDADAVGWGRIKVQRSTMHATTYSICDIHAGASDLHHHCQNFWDAQIKLHEYIACWSVFCVQMSYKTVF
jgi:hypothetical protein